MDQYKILMQITDPKICWSKINWDQNNIETKIIFEQYLEIDNFMNLLIDNGCISMWHILSDYAYGEIIYKSTLYCMRDIQ